MVQDRDPKKTTLAIGAGANNVSMIRTAEIGVGIIGEVTAQAECGATYAIESFRYLKNLLFTEDREPYRLK